MLSNTTSTSRILKVCCDTEGRELTDERRYAPTSVPLRRKPCSRSPETLFHFTGIPIDRFYRRKRFTSERERVEYLFASYERMRVPLAAAAAKPGTRRRVRRRGS